MFQTDRLSSLANVDKFILNFQRSVRDGYYTALSYDVIHFVYICLSESRIGLVRYFDLRPEFSVTPRFAY